jgi:hypothetical protein
VSELGLFGPLASGKPCEAHGSHRPTAQYTELHHVVPQAWQLTWAPVPPAASGHLWDPRTVALCPTGHRNVHFWLVRLMHALPASVLDARRQSHDRAAIQQALTRVRLEAPKDGRRIVANEFEFARLAPMRWVDAGGNLGDLIRAKQFGAA